MIKANDSNRKSWISVPKNSDFPIQNIPFGIFKKPNKDICLGTRIGDTAIDLSQLNRLNYFKGIPLKRGVFEKTNLNEFLKQTKTVWRLVRDRIAEIFDIENQMDALYQKEVLHPISNVEMLMPIKVGDYTDFYSSKQHAHNVGCMFRDPKKALLPNWLHMPVAYHGRASSIIPSGTNIHRPTGQQLLENSNQPVFGPTKLLDFELEMAFITGQGKALGEHISTSEAENYIFGMCIFNDWSARDLQKWEYVPLGPFLGKNFASSISPWIVTLDALEPFRVNGETQKPDTLPYLKFRGRKNLDIHLEVKISSKAFEPTLVSRTNFKHLYWNMSQQLTHHSINGCNINAGDIMASGTISGEKPNSYGSLLELTWNGTKPIKMPDGTERKFLNDYDTVHMTACAKAKKHQIGFGEIRTKILPAKKSSFTLNY